ncbi:MAG: TatD family hydrolase [Ilumatobacteraceae bacterium]
MAADSTTWFDSHCHVYDEKVPGGPDGSLDVARAAGIGGFLVVGCDRATSLAAIDIAGRHDDVWATVGLHPHEASHGVDTIRDLIDRPGVVAIGEAGLDHHYDHSPRAEQSRAFAEQITLANDHDLPLVIHTREAWSETFAILDAEGMPRRCVFHCFTGGPDELEQCLERGALVSFSGIVSFPGATELRAAAERCPLESMLVETDSPYLAPVPHRGRPNQPAWVAAFGTANADLRSIPVAAAAAATTANARRLIGLG